MSIHNHDQPMMITHRYPLRFTDQDLDEEHLGGRISWTHPPLMQRVPWNGANGATGVMGVVHGR